MDKTLEFISRMYTEINSQFQAMSSEIKTGFANINERLEDIEKRQIVLENRLEDTRKILFDGYIQNIEQYNRIEQRVDSLSEKAEMNDVEIRVIKGGKA